MADNNKPYLVPSLLQMKCPNCRRGKIFVNRSLLPLKTCLQMHERCTVCNVKYAKEQNMGYGINYVLTVMMMFLNLVWYYPIFGIGYEDNSLYSFLIVTTIITILLQPWFMRLSRVLFFYFTIYYNSYKN